MKKIWRALRLIPIIIRNLFFIIFESVGHAFRRRPWIAGIAILVVLAAIIGGGVIEYKKYKRSQLIAQMTGGQVTLSQAAAMGKVTVHKLLVQIENIKCPAGQSSQCYQRGDIVLIMPGNHHFSIAEKTGFLVVPVKLTDKQTELLVQATQKDTGKNGPDGQPILDTTAMRRYAVNLAKLGISPDDQRGKELTTTYKWSDIIFEKKGN